MISFNIKLILMESELRSLHYAIYDLFPGSSSKLSKVDIAVVN